MHDPIPDHWTGMVNKPLLLRTSESVDDALAGIACVFEPLRGHGFANGFQFANQRVTSLANGHATVAKTLKRKARIGFGCLDACMFGKCRAAADNS